MAANVIKKKGKRVVKYDFQLAGYNLDTIPYEYRHLIRTKRDNILNSQGREIILSYKIDWENNKIITNSDPIGVDTSARMLMIWHFGIFGKRNSISAVSQTRGLNICL